jgi:hypothetical protein
MDNFRRFQRGLCHNGAPTGGRDTYGCPCCRKFSFAPRFKAWSRRLAKVRFRRETLRLIESVS